jgi:anti-anti-sigma factor
MTFTKETHEQAEVIKVDSSIFFDAVQEFDMLIQEAEESQLKVVVDFSGAEMVCSSAITTLVKHHMSLKNKGGSLIISGCNVSVKKIFQLLGLDKVMRIADTLRAALD